MFFLVLVANLGLIIFLVNKCFVIAYLTTLINIGCLRGTFEENIKI